MINSLPGVSCKLLPNQAFHIASELESLFTDEDVYDPMASVQISLNVMMMGNAWQDKRLYGIASRAAQRPCDVKTLGKPVGEVALRQLLDELSELLREPKFSKEE